VFERFTDRARRVIVLAQEEARLLRHNYVGTEHFLLGLVREGSDPGVKALAASGVSLETVRAEVVEIIGPAESPPGEPLPFTPRAKKVLELSLREARDVGDTSIDTRHILSALVREGDGVAVHVLVKLGVDVSRLRVSGPIDEPDTEIDVDVATTSDPDGPPRCPRCGADLTEHAVYRATDDGIALVFCGRCHSTIGTVATSVPA
jgi:ATP-dependent Clp protease ATP-binding subunit ClpA